MGSASHFARKTVTRRSTKGRSQARGLLERRRAFVREFRIERALPLDDVQSELRKRGFEVHKSTVSRDAAYVAEQISIEYSTRFDVFAEIGTTCARLDHATADVSKALAGKVTPMERAALTGKLAILILAKFSVLQRVGLLPQDVTTLITLPDAPAERIPTGAELRQEVTELLNAARVLDSDLIPRAEREGDWGDGDPRVVDAEPAAPKPRELPEQLPRAVGAEDLSAPVRAAAPTRRIAGITTVKFTRVPDRDDGPQF
jgi:hypothetical protein